MKKMVLSINLILLSSSFTPLIAGTVAPVASGQQIVDQRTDSSDMSAEEKKKEDDKTNAVAVLFSVIALIYALNTLWTYRNI